MSNGLAALLVAAAPAKAGALEAVDDLNGVLQRRFDEGRAAWPTVEVSPEKWAAHLASHLGEAPAKLVGSLHSDFYLAVGLVEANRAALDLFLSEFMPRLQALLERRAPTSGVVSQVMSKLEDRLLVGGGEKGTGIASYSGRGSLDRFLRAAAINQLMNELRTPQADALTETVASALVDLERTPELSALSRNTREIFATALQAAFRSLPDRQRLLLKLHTFENATITDLGRLYQVHKVTAFRWLEEARNQLRLATIKQLREHHRIPETELESFIRHLPVSLEASLKTIFRSLEG